MDTIYAEREHKRGKDSAKLDPLTVGEWEGEGEEEGEGGGDPTLVPTSHIR